jgi:hypothetical protein
VLIFEFQVGDLKNIWLIDSGCSRHMTGDKGWFSSLVPVVTRRYITFGDNGRGRVLSEGEIKVSDKITLKRVALVQSLGYNLLSVSQLLDEGFECFGLVVLGFWTLEGTLSVWLFPRVRCFVLLSCLSKLNLVQGLPRLRLEKELVCAPCRHTRMVASSDPHLTDVMTEHPCELLHMDLVGPARVRSAGGKWYVLFVVDDYSRYAWVFFLEHKGETFGIVRDLVLRLRNERHEDAIRARHRDNGSEFRNSRFEIVLP